MDDVKIAAVMRLGQWLSYSSKLAPEIKQLYLAGIFIIIVCGINTKQHAFLCESYKA